MRLPLINRISTNSQAIREIPSRNKTFVDTLTDCTRTPRITNPTTLKMQAAGMIMPLKRALPAVVPMPTEKPSASANTNKAISVVNSSGTELEMALIVPPRTPSERLRPMYSLATSNPSHALQINKQVKKIRTRGMTTPITCTDSEWGAEDRWADPYRHPLD